MATHFNRSSSIQRRRALRRAQTYPEKILWSQIRGSAICGIRFQRQFSIGPFIVDFYAASIRLAIEIDGASHDTDDARLYDARRTRYLEKSGVRVLRFRNEEVVEDCDRVVVRITGAVEQMRVEKGKG